MLTFLRNIVEIILNIPEYILYAIETVCNLFFEGVQALFVVATSLIPLPEEPGMPEFVGEINWFFPLGAVISVGTPIVTGYIAFLAVRWIYKWSGNL